MSRELAPDWVQRHQEAKISEYFFQYVRLNVIDRTPMRYILYHESWMTPFELDLTALSEWYRYAIDRMNEIEVQFTDGSSESLWLYFTEFGAECEREIRKTYRNLLKNHLDINNQDLEQYFQAMKKLRRKIAMFHTIGTVLYFEVDRELFVTLCKDLQRQLNEESQCALISD